MVPPEFRVCKKCGTEKPLTGFTKAKSCLHGRSHTCYTCHNAPYGEYRRRFMQQSRKENPELWKSYKRKYRATSAGKAKDKEWKTDNRGRRLLKEKERYQRTKERHRETGKAWRVANPERFKALTKRRRDKVTRDPLLNFARRIRHAVWRAYKFAGIVKRTKTYDSLGYSPAQLFAHLEPSLGKQCDVCSDITLTLESAVIDHILPLGAANSHQHVLQLNQLTNLRLICDQCNSLKVTEDMEYIRKVRGNE